MFTEKEKLASEEYMRCSCHNVIPVSSVYCPFCKSFNAATSAKNCPTCGQDLAKQE